MKFLLILYVFFNGIQTQTCPPDNLVPINSVNNYWNIPDHGIDGGLEVMTWNLKQFPLSENETVGYVQEIIADLKIDLIAFQEINDYNSYENLKNLLPAYNFIITDYGGNFSYNLAFAYRTDFLSLNYSSTLFNTEGYNFAYRYPFLASFNWQCGGNNINFHAINVHLKAFGDSESFNRRYESCQIMSDYLNSQVNMGNDKIIILGDFNDEIDEMENDNSLWPLVTNPNSEFITAPLVNNNFNNSYILSGGSFIDHILVSSGFNDYLNNHIALTLRLDDYVGSENYINNISDHRPVLWKIYINNSEYIPNLVINEIMNNPNSVGDQYGEWFEIYNNSDEDIDLNNFMIYDNDNDYHVINQSDLVVQSGEFIILGNNSDQSTNGGINIDYEYSNFNLSNSFDEIIIALPNGFILDEIFYDNGITFPDPNGKSMSLNDIIFDNSIGSNWSESQFQNENGDYCTPGVENFGCLEMMWFADFDNDSLGDSSNYILSCEQPENYVDNANDSEPYCGTNDTDICGICAGSGVNGDINYDNSVNIVDVVQLVGYILGDLNLELLSICKGDLSMDDMINIIDIVLIVNIILED